MCFATEAVLYHNKIDNSNPVDQLSSLALRLPLLCGMWKKKFFLSLLHKTVISFLAELYLKCWLKEIGHDVQFLSCIEICFVIWLFRTFGTKCAWFNRVDKGSALPIHSSILISDETGINSQFLTHEENDSLKLLGPHLICLSVFHCQITLERKFIWHLLRNSNIKK